MSIRVLLADDDTDFLDVTAYALRRAGFVVSTASNGEEALEAWRNEDHDIVLLDVNMPETPGIQVCQVIRGTSAIPVVLMSGNKREGEIIRGFEAGADDYIAKPFSPQHLVMRLRAIHKRASGQTAEVTPRHLVLPPLVIDLDSFSVTMGERPVRLTRLEFLLFYCLAANVGRVVSTSRLIDFAWGLDGEGDVSLLKTHFSHIRRKVAEVSDHPIAIRALAGAGYSLHIGSPEPAIKTGT
jgi:DNA-binding response OmpR family regulator